MELSILLMKQIFAMVIIMIVGFTFVRINLLKEEDGKILSKIILYAACPCTIVNSFLMDYTPAKVEGLLIGIIAGIVVHIIFMILVAVFEKMFQLNPIESVSLVATNAGYILIPLVNATLGSEYVFYCSSFIVVQTIFFWTYVLFKLGQKQEVNFKKIIFNPNIIAIILGLILFFGQLKIPVILNSAMTNMGNATGALSMLVIGMSIGNVDLKKIFTNPRSYIVVFLRLIVFPVIIIGIIWATRICTVNPVAKNVLICTMLASAAPVAAAITQFAEVFDITPQRAGMINVLSVFGCIITMPVMVWLYQVLC